MKLDKPYGRTKTTRNQSGVFKRVLVEHRDPNLQLDVGEFVVSDPKVVIAQWVQIIDKVATKPFDGSPPSSEQREFRQALADAVLKRMLADNLLPDPHNRRKRLEKQYWKRVHPYREQTDDRVSQNPKGRWYSRFAATERVLDNDFVTMAESIHQHLYIKEHTIADETLKTTGKIKSRARSITNSTLHAQPSNKRWSDEELLVYANAGDVAGAIRFELSELIDKGRRVDRRVIGGALSLHYAKLFKDGATEILSIQEATAHHSGLVALHESVKRYYRDLVRSGRRDLASTLPSFLRNRRFLFFSFGCHLSKINGRFQYIFPL